MSAFKQPAIVLAIIFSTAIAGIVLIIFYKSSPEGQNLSPSSEFAPTQESSLANKFNSDEDLTNREAQSQQIEPQSTQPNALVATNGFEPQTFSEQLENYSIDEQARLTQFSDDHFGALEFSSPEQREWLRRHGYPDAKDILEAEYLSFEELQERADAGDRVAMALASARALNLMMEEGYARKELGEEPLSNQDAMEYYLWSRRYADQLQRRGSPFGAYLKARWKFESTLLSTAEPMNDSDLASVAKTAVNSLYVAKLMGDDRIDRFAQRFAYATGIDTDVIVNIRSAFLAVRAAQAGMDCETLFRNERIP